MYESYWPELIKGLQYFLRRLQEDPDFTRHFNMPLIKELFASEDYHDGLYAWALIDQEDSTGQTILSHLIAGDLIPKIHKLPSDIFKKFLRDTLNSYESLIHIEEVTDFSIHGNDMISGQSIVFYWLHASKYFEEDQYFFARYLKTEDMYRGLVLTPPRFLTAEQAKLIKDEMPELKTLEMANFVRDMGWAKAMKILAIKNFVITKDMGAFEESYIPPFEEPEIKTVEKTEEEDQTPEISIDWSPMIANTLIGSFLESLTLEHSDLEIVDYINGIGQFAAVINIDQLDRDIPIEDGMMERYFKFIAKKGMVFSIDDFHHQVQILLHFTQFLKNKNEKYSPLYEEMQYIYEHIFDFLHLLTDSSGLLLNKKLYDMIVPYIKNLPPLLEDFQTFLYYLVNNYVKVTDVKHALRQEIILSLHSILALSYKKPGAKSDQMTSYPYIEALYHFCMEKYLFTIEKEIIALTDYGVRFIQLTDEEQFILLLQYWLEKENLSWLFEEQDAVDTFWTTLCREKDAAATMKGEEKYLYAYVMDALSLVDLDLHTDGSFDVSLTDLSRDVIMPWYFDAQHGEDVIYLDDHRD